MGIGLDPNQGPRRPRRRCRTARSRHGWPRLVRGRARLRARARARARVRVRVRAPLVQG